MSVILKYTNQCAIFHIIIHGDLSKIILQTDKVLSEAFSRERRHCPLTLGHPLTSISLLLSLVSFVTNLHVLI